MATTIPLCCNICPQEPEFSDLSHLLTHVSSKGHLSHHLKAQLRGRHAVDIRWKLGVYDEWYEQHNIEQLLSQRLSAKVSKQGVDKQYGKSSKPAQRSRNRKSRFKSSTSPPPKPSPVKNEPAIDPQLSNSHGRPQDVSEFPTDSNQPYDDDKPQPYVPRMSDWQIDTHAASQQNCYSPSNTDPGKGLDSDCFRSFIRSPSGADYSELPETKKHIPWSQTLQNDEQPGRLQGFHARALFQVERKDYHLIEADPLHSPTLKGVRWPGMSLFDSASLDAQRLRNQKKDGSILEQMAQNSMSVEQMEDIYWPNGSLKKRRLITGNVDSSPTSQPSPMPKRSRRSRTDKTRSALADLSTNGSRMPKKRGRRNQVEQTGSHSADNNMSSKVRRALPSNLLPKCGLFRDLMVNPKKQVSGGSPSLQPLRQAFQVFKDASGQNSQGNHHKLRQNRSSSDNALPSGRAGVKRGAITTNDTMGSLDWYDQLNSYVKGPTRSENAENVPPRPMTSVQTEHPQASAGRVTQRYFSITSNEEPQFFDSMPPHMDFGGMAGPQYRGAFLNPLNPLNPYVHSLQSQSSRAWTSSARGLTSRGSSQYRNQPEQSGSSLRRKVREPKDT